MKLFSRIPNNKVPAYISLFFVVLVWGAAPLATLHLYKFYSPTIRVFFSEIVLAFSYLLISRKHLREFDISYLKAGIPTGFFLALANISQKIGLLHTTPARYAFLENLSCITVPIVLFFIIKKKPSFTTLAACLVCLLSTFEISGLTFQDTSSWGIGETLCALSGLLYGFNIAGTSVFARRLYAPLYLLVQSLVGTVLSFVFSLVLNFVTVPANGGTSAPLEKIVFSFRLEHIFLLIFLTVLASAFCWILRTNAMKHIDAGAVAVIMPMSSVVTGVLSVLSGKDTLNINLVLGALFGVVAVLLSCYDDIMKYRKEKEKIHPPMQREQIS